MELSFRGKPYEVSFPTVEVVEINETATFLGRPYARKQFNVAQRHQPTSELIYRGIRYTR